MINSNTYININGCLTKEGIIYFLENDTDNSIQNKIEEHLQECELCRDSVSGYKKLNNSKKIDLANTSLNERFLASKKENKSKLLPTQQIINIATAAAVIVIAILIVKNFTRIDYVTEAPVYNEDLALLSKKELTRPSPPDKVTQEKKKSSSQNRKPEPTIDVLENEKIDIAEKQNIVTNNIPSGEPNHNLPGYTDKKLVDKSYTEFQITLPVEVDRRGYSNTDNNVITASYEKGSALSALPSFNGKGMEGFAEYIAKNIKYPQEARDFNITGVVEVQFAVDVDGKVKDIEIKKGISPILDREAYRIIMNSPKWIPGFVNGKPTKVFFRFPVNFRIE